MKKFVFCILVILVSCIGRDKSSPVSKAEQIVERAKVLTSYIPVKNLQESIYSWLSHIVIIESSKNGEVKFGPETKLILVLSDESALPSQKNVNSREIKIAPFAFASEEAVKSGNFIIVMNQNIYNYTDNFDGLACGIIHEIMHAIRQAKRIQSGAIEVSSEMKFQEELEVWTNTVYIYQQVHAEILSKKCDCGTFQVEGESIKDIDPLEKTMIVFQWCREKFLKTLYVE
jgi:hypothetical protein